MKLKYIISKKIIWILFALLMASMACSLSDVAPAPTAIVYPTAAVASTSPPSPPPPPTEVPMPKAEISATLTEIIVDEWTEIEYEITDADGISLVQITLNGELLLSDDYTDENVSGMESKFPWSTFEPGEYTFSLIGYDFNNRPSEPATLIVTVSPRISAEIANVSAGAIVGNPVVINYSVKSNTGTGLSSVEVTLNSTDGEIIAFDRADDLKTETGKVEYGSQWIPNNSGEYTLYLTAYDLDGRPSGADTVKITVLPRVSVEITNIPAEAIVGKPVDIELSVESNTGAGFSSAELTLNSVDGEYIFFDRAENLKTETGKIEYGVTWTPTQAGEHTLFLTAYDLDGNPSGTDTVIIKVLPAP